MDGWSRASGRNGSARAVLAVMLVALVLVAAVPVALLVGLFLMLFGHVLVGLALFGGSVLAALAGVSLAVLSGVRQVHRFRDAVTRRDLRVLRLSDDDYSYLGQQRD